MASQNDRDWLAGVLRDIEQWERGKERKAFVHAVSWGVGAFIVLALLVSIFAMALAQ